MSGIPRRRRGRGSLGQLKARLWAVIEYNVRVVEDDRLEHEWRQKASNSLVQAALAYAKLIELHELHQEMSALEHMASRNGNGHHP